LGVEVFQSGEISVFIGKFERDSLAGGFGEVIGFAYFVLVQARLKDLAERVIESITLFVEPFQTEKTLLFK
jgi:hypothetical protein